MCFSRLRVVTLQIRREDRKADMNSFSVLKWNNVSESLKEALSSAPEFPCEKIALVVEYQQASRLLSECHQLYQLFDWNWKQFETHIICDFYDNISDPENKKRDLTLEINGLTANVISSGKSLIDYLQACSKDDEVFRSFNEMRTTKYSKKEAYCLLYELRNYVQHGQLIVATYCLDGKIKACFDLYQLKDPMFFTLRKTIENILNTGIELIESVDGSPKLSFGLYMYQYNKEIRELYLNFLKCFKNKIDSATKALFSYLRKNPQLLISLPDGSKGLVYRQDDTLHLLMGLETKLSKQSYYDCLREVKTQSKQANRAAKKREKRSEKVQ